jgi:subtilisin-like proprotein convertase family protein
VGGAATGSANLISANGNPADGNGVYIYGSGTSGNVVLGNKIGTDVSGAAKLGNTFNGVLIGSGALVAVVNSSGTINTPLPAGQTVNSVLNVAQNFLVEGVSVTLSIQHQNDPDLSATLIAPNGSMVLLFSGVGTSGTTPHANFTNTTFDDAAATPISNASTQPVSGITGSFKPQHAFANTFVGQAGSKGNWTLQIHSNSSTLNGTLVNWSLTLLGKTDGVRISSGATANTVGGSAPGAANVISGNKYGVSLQDSGTSGNVVLGNKIGTDVNGTAALGNTNDGVAIDSGASGNTVGGTATGAGNVLSGNGSNGVEIKDAGTSGNVVLGNLIGTDLHGAPVLGNANDGVFLWQGASANTIGGSGAAANLIAGNAANAVEIKQTPGQAVANLVQGLSRPTDTLTFDAQQNPVGTVPGTLTITAPSQQVNYVGVTGLSLNNAQAVDAFYGPNTSARATAFVIDPSTNLPFVPPLTANERYVQVLYLNALGRPGSRAELDFWAARFGSEPQAPAQSAVAAGVEHSAEGRAHLVGSWYANYLGRPAQGGEAQGWVNLLLAGSPEEAVLSDILGSQEFFNHAQTLAPGSSANERFVQALYLLLLNRTGEASGVAFWVAAVPAAGRQGVALGFLRSVEFRTYDFEGYYDALLHRPSDAAGLNGWVMSNMDVGSVRIAFETSPEFFTNG